MEKNKLFKEEVKNICVLISKLEHGTIKKLSKEIKLLFKEKNPHEDTVRRWLYDTNKISNAEFDNIIPKIIAALIATTKEVIDEKEKDLFFLKEQLEIIEKKFENYANTKTKKNR